MVVIDIARQQRMDALGRANEVRVWKAERKRVIAALDDPHSLVAVMFRDPQGMEGAFTVKEALCALPGVAMTKAQRAAFRANVGFHRMIRDLPPSQRERIAQQVESFRPAVRRAA